MCVCRTFPSYCSLPCGGVLLHSEIGHTDGIEGRKETKIIERGGGIIHIHTYMIDLCRFLKTTCRAYVFLFPHNFFRFKCETEKNENCCLLARRNHRRCFLLLSPGSIQNCLFNKICLARNWIILHWVDF